MRGMALLVVVTVVLSGCSSGNWTPTRWIDTPQGQAEFARLQQEQARTQDAARADDAAREAREAEIARCEEGNEDRRRIARLYSQTTYDHVDCRPYLYNE